MSSQMRSDTCIFTISSNNYLHYSNTLFESLRQHCPDIDLVLGLCDIKTNDSLDSLADFIVPIDQLSIPHLGNFIYQYSILELNTAIKPYVIEMLMTRGYKKIIYFDPDIRVYRPLDQMISMLDQHNVLLTPHLTDQLDDNKTPSELQILQAGSYNLGYIALRACDETRKFIKWWQAKLFKDCVVDIPKGLFVDQKWIDLAPSMFEGVFINRDPSWNVAYWNLNHRELKRAPDGSFTINDCPLTFFHYSGFSIESNTLSKHQNRFNKGAKGTPLRELCSAYEQALLRNDISRFKRLPYAFSQFADGTQVPDSARHLIRSSPKLAKIDYFDQKQCIQIHVELNRTVVSTAGGIALTALAIALWESRADLRKAFPAIEGVDSVHFAEWLIQSAAREAGFSEIYLSPIRNSLKILANQSASNFTSPASKFMSMLFRVVWKQRRRIPINFRIALQPYAAWVLKMAYPRRTGINSSLMFKAKAASNICAVCKTRIGYLNERSCLDTHEMLSYYGLPSSNELGINLIGYLHAESGVGEAARSSLRAIKQSDLSYSLIDYRLGNSSRMAEQLEVMPNESIYPINLMHVNADQTKIARDYLGAELFSERYTIGYWYWEMPKFPESLHFAYAQVDEIWVSTEYNRIAIAEHTNKPVHVIPPAIEVKLEKPLTRSDLHLPEDSFIFLHMSDVLSIPQRKNPLGVVEAFMKAFSDKPDAKVKLVIKLSNLDHQPNISKAIFSAIDQDKRIQVLHEYLDRNTLNNLINACDCYVSLHRAEGFGLPIAEAMYLGKPVIATHWSGNVDFMTAENSLPVDYQLVTLKEDYGPYQKGQSWAEPDLESAANLMLEIYHNPEKAKALGLEASRFIKTRYSPESTAKIINARCSVIAEGLAKPIKLEQS